MAASTLAGIGKMTELRQRILFVLGAMVVFRLGTHIPIPGVDPGAVAAMFEQTRGSIVDIFNMFSGGALERLSIFALGVMPYISASIIIQMMTSIVPQLEQLKKEGESGRRKITQYTRYGTVALATFQALGIAIAVEGQQAAGGPVVLIPGLGFKITTVATLVTGTMFLVWLGEQITERGIGNGVSLIIFGSIVAGLPSAVAGTLELARTGTFTPIGVLALFIGAIAITAVVVFVERGQRRITVNYAKRQQGRRMLAGQTSHLPLKLNMAGVIPPIFASSIILFPASLGSWFGQSEGLGWLRDISTTLSPGQPIYALVYAAMIVFFCFFYTALVFNPNEIADNLKKSGAFIPGVRPGLQTAGYIDRVVSRLTLGGAVYLTVVCLIPEFLIVKWGVPFYFGGTSLLIIVVVMMDMMSQIQSHLMSRQYESLMKKSSLVGGGMGLTR
ncbi:MAG TPA: preprotein translocase subunit SecY [Arenicellales bacterium]|jgi:preprotein translocase subunit SecY|uniref:Protein translocase subunit SecY n=1 Tax=marine metagenome TaxID=408172 RepID=A0A381UQ78_9ZZZZ|nr:preprotein translocase subunit SecY [Acidiferrobacteraceae bacterium]MDP6137513.1 preprotein translocase subunit SecY [Arenicellales bacterium]MDP7221330.1 preprotein translocase subunit SecY [Arenicellales bacterium]HCF73870.1 preprotein translocase subunit SecY [Gammaproteobacteria bacterium]HJP10439.1 preprotein translocase subunit SecY [Arenicellales bacterium]|tara:strand:- start:581 stop:1915 length:1335 start_codon:yes stop_codon:yes gene_type:complete